MGMNKVFTDASSFHGDINNWDTKKVINMNRMFEGAESFNQDVDSWDTSSVTRVTKMFSGAGASPGICSWELKSLVLPNDEASMGAPPTCSNIKVNALMVSGGMVLSANLLGIVMCALAY